MHKCYFCIGHILHAQQSITSANRMFTLAAETLFHLHNTHNVIKTSTLFMHNCVNIY